MASTSGRQRERRVGGTSFTSAIDARWTVHTRTGAGGFETLALSSRGARLDAVGIPLPGAVGITVSEGPATTIERRAGRAPAQPAANLTGTRAARQAQAAIALMSAVVRTPGGAQWVELSSPARFLTLAGASAAEESYEYVFGGRGNVQVDVVARRGDRIYFIELDTEPAHIAQGESAFVRLLRNWRWR
ncbi:MAG TPA: hypothetical protein VH115_02795 [Solirubrobacteraceae bacterium]|nr:hypothetical protein [Solirubrobacteraceae bacterium]